MPMYNLFLGSGPPVTVYACLEGFGWFWVDRRPLLPLLAITRPRGSQGVAALF